MKPNLVVFARAPRLGTVKRRLARQVGMVEALRFHRDNTGRLLRRLGRDRRWRTWLAVTPDRDADRPGGLWPGRFTVVPQGPGDLGARMGRLFQHLPGGPVAIVGSDIPGIECRHVAEALRALGAHDWVLGPAADGGYWLIGARRTGPLRTPFADVAWGSDRALADTLANLRDQRVALLPTLADVDRAEDLAALPRRSGRSGRTATFAPKEER